METDLSLTISTVAGVVLSLVLAYAPGVSAWWEDLSSEHKRAALAILYLAVSAGLYIPSCFGGPSVVACDVSSIWDVVTAYVLTLVANQATYVLLPQETKARMASD